MQRLFNVSYIIKSILSEIFLRMFNIQNEFSEIIRMCINDIANYYHLGINMECTKAYQVDMKKHNPQAIVHKLNAKADENIRCTTRSRLLLGLDFV